MNAATTLAVTMRVTNTTDGSGIERTYDRFPVRIGRSALNDLQLEFGFVTQFHAVIERNDQTLFLRDLGSRNGSAMGGKKVAPHQSLDLAASGFTFDIGPLHFQLATTMVAKTAAHNRTAIMMALEGEDPKATQVWQEFTAAPPTSAREPRDVALMGLRQLAKLYVPEAGALQDAESIQRFLSKIKQALDLFFGAYVPLRDGCRQFQSQMDIGRGMRADSEAAEVVQTARKPSQIAARVLDWRDPSTEVAHALQQTFADFVIHQLALLDGVMGGVRALLRELSPEVVEAAFAKKGASMRFGPFRGDALWKMYAERHKDFSEEESQAFSLIFGDQFVKAYRQFRADRDPSRASMVPGQK